MPHAHISRILRIVFVSVFLLLTVASYSIGTQIPTARAHGSANGPLIGCQGTRLYGRNPSLTGCDNYQSQLDTVPIYAVNGDYLGAVFLDGSGRCNAKWAVTLAANGGYRVSARINGKNGDSFGANGIGIVHTLMVGAQQAFACGTISGRSNLHTDTLG